ncbi:MAG: hypothetical protein VR72_06235 [Clostridiaceae bacterium BRH_c20a]|nr:MAG: hypothetical protein VR72_06235 [Clostridiaceae bacterium BRH_c20a]
MALPSRKERRKKNTYSNLTKSILLIIIVSINLTLFYQNNNSLLLFALPLSITFLFYSIFKRRGKFLYINLLLLIMAYLIYLEFSFRLWAQK